MIRLLHFVVQPVLVIDNGDSLMAGPKVEPQFVSLADLRALADKWPDHLAQIEAQMQTTEASAADI